MVLLWDGQGWNIHAVLHSCFMAATPPSAAVFCISVKLLLVQALYCVILLMLVIGSNAHRYSISSFMDWFLMGLRMLFPRDDCHTRSGMSKEVLNLSCVPDPAHPSGSGTKSQDSSHLHWREARSGAWCESLECGGQTFLHQVSVAPDLFHKSG